MSCTIEQKKGETARLEGNNYDSIVLMSINFNNKNKTLHLQYVPLWR